jgi:hypothetical protein
MIEEMTTEPVAAPVIDLREASDIAFVREQMGIPHVSDPDALAAFTDGRGVFDVDPHCRRLDAFVTKHKLEAHIESEDLLPGTDSAPGKRPVYYGRARWIKRSELRNWPDAPIPA